MTTPRAPSKAVAPHLHITGELRTLLAEAHAHSLPHSVLGAISEAIELCDLTPTIAEAEAAGKQMYIV